MKSMSRFANRDAIMTFDLDVMKQLVALIIWIPMSMVCWTTMAANTFAALCDDRVAVERVYQSHRAGAQSTFDLNIARSQVERVVQDHLEREWVLRNVFGVSITPEMTSNEIRRIDLTTRAPEMLAEIKEALGGDVDRFGRSIVQPILVERLLRERFDQQTSLHDSQRAQASSVRDQLRAEKNRGVTVGQLLQSLIEITNASTHEVTWRFSSPRDSSRSDDEKREYSIRGVAIGNDFGSEVPTSADAYVTGGNLTSVGNDRPKDLGSDIQGRGVGGAEFNALPVDLRRVLDTQLKGPGDVSAVIESENAFRVFVGLRRDPFSMTAMILTVRKRSFEEWVHEVAGRKPASVITIPKQGRS